MSEKSLINEFQERTQRITEAPEINERLPGLEVCITETRFTMQMALGERRVTVAHDQGAEGREKLIEEYEQLTEIIGIIANRVRTAIVSHNERRGEDRGDLARKEAPDPELEAGKSRPNDRTVQQRIENLRIMILRFFFTICCLIKYQQLNPFLRPYLNNGTFVVLLKRIITEIKKQEEKFSKAEDKKSAITQKLTAAMTQAIRGLETLIQLLETELGQARKSKMYKLPEI